MIAQKAALERAMVRAGTLAGHALWKEKRMWHCSTCGNKGVMKKALKWAKRPCVPPTVQRTNECHSTHNVRSHRGLRYCLRCGALGALRLVKLKKPCTGRLTRDGFYDLRRIGRGELPRRFTQWPEADGRVGALAEAGGADSEGRVGALAEVGRAGGVR